MLLGVAVAALLVFAASLGNRVSQSAATVVATVMLTALVLPYVALAYVVGAEASDAAKPLFEITLAATPVLALPLALLVASTGLAALAAHRRFGVASLGAAPGRSWSSRQRRSRSTADSSSPGRSQAMQAIDIQRLHA